MGNMTQMMLGPWSPPRLVQPGSGQDRVGCFSLSPCLVFGLP